MFRNGKNRFNIEDTPVDGSPAPNAQAKPRVSGRGRHSGRAVPLAPEPRDDTQRAFIGPRGPAPRPRPGNHTASAAYPAGGEDRGFGGFDRQWLLRPAR